jgi:hypothetical protein
MWKRIYLINKALLIDKVYVRLYGFCERIEEFLLEYHLKRLYLEEYGNKG